MDYKKKGNNKKENNQNQEYVRVRLPRGKEVIGILQERLGGSRNKVRCLDGKTRICRIPGRLKRSLWVRPGDFVIVEPWEFGGDEKGDIVYKYSKGQADWLRRKGYLKELEELDEF